jgi:hypothetical protein
MQKRPPYHANDWDVRAFDARHGLLLEADGVAGVEGIISELQEAGWMVSRWHPDAHVRAWRADALPVTRIDCRFDEGAGRWRIRKFKAGWTGTTEPVADYLAPAGWSIDEALAFFAESPPDGYADPDGWFVNRAGARFVRAWRGKREPVRRKGAVLRRRREVEEWVVAHNGDDAHRPAWLPSDIPPSAFGGGFGDYKFDLAFYF